MEKTKLDPADLIRLDAELWFSTYGTIKDKRGKIVKAPKPNVLQKRMFKHYRECQAKGEPCKMIVLKPRQKGASTCCQALAYHHFMKYPSLNGSLMGDIAGTSDKVFEIFRRFAENDQFPWVKGQPTLASGGSKADEIKTRSGSVFGKETAGSKNAGRSGTIQVGNMTEVAFWATSGHSDPALAYLQSLYDEGVVSLCIADSTPNGPSGWFYDTCLASMEERNDWKFIFAAWFEFADSVIPFKSDAERDEFAASLDDDEKLEIDKYGCDMEQMNWRRRTVMDKCGGDRDKFRQEYPSDPMECFLMSSRPKFNPTCLEKIESMLTPPLAVGTPLVQDPKLRTAVLQPDPRGDLRVWEYPKEGCSYLVSIDTCTGEDQQVSGLTADPDYHSAQVWRQAYRDHRGDWHRAALVALHRYRVPRGRCGEHGDDVRKLHDGPRSEQQRTRLGEVPVGVRSTRVPETQNLQRDEDGGEELWMEHGSGNAEDGNRSFGPRAVGRRNRNIRTKRATGVQDFRGQRQGQTRSGPRSPRRPRVGGCDRDIQHRRVYAPAREEEKSFKKKARERPYLLMSRRVE